MSKLVLDLHPIYNQGDARDRKRIREYPPAGHKGKDTGSGDNPRQREWTVEKKSIKIIK